MAVYESENELPCQTPYLLAFNVIDTRNRFECCG